MTDSRTRDERIADLLNLQVKIETPEDQRNFEIFNSLPDELKFSLLMEHNKGFRDRVFNFIRQDMLADKEGQ